MTAKNGYDSKLPIMIYYSFVGSTYKHSEFINKAFI